MRPLSQFLPLDVTPAISLTNKSSLEREGEKENNKNAFFVCFCQMQVRRSSLFSHFGHEAESMAFMLVNSEKEGVTGGIEIKLWFYEWPDRN